MSQAAGTAGSGFSVHPQKATSGLAVLLLALAVAVGAIVLHELDSTPAPMGTGDESSTQAASVQPAAQPAAPMMTSPRPPAEVRVLVANGTRVDGAASRVSSRLAPIGYQLMRPGNTTATSQASVVQFAPGYQAEAQQLASSLGFPAGAVQPLAAPAPVADLQASNVVVIVGSQGLPQSQGVSGNNGQGATQGSQGPLTQQR